MTDNTRVFNCDCLPAMKEFPDKYFDLAIVDPPYGLGDKLTIGGGWATGRTNKDHEWDNVPNEDYFEELFRVSTNQIIWGGNYFNLDPTRGFIIWDKPEMRIPTMSDCEFAWTSFDRPAKIATISRGFKQKQIHICQKPVRLYSWLLKNYAKEGDKILDTHLGSQSSRIAAYDMGFDFTGYELDKDYFEAGCKRFEQFKSQTKIQFV